MSNAAAIETQAAAWLARLDEPDWSSADQAALDAWLDEATAHRVAYIRLESVWRRADRLAALRGQEARPRFRLPAVPMRIAAGLLVTLALGAALFAYIDQGGRSYATGLGGHEILRLTDGSRVELNTDTRLRTALEKDRRVVWLDKGEAYFEVAHDPSRPFVIYAGQRRVTVLGTKFSVRRERDGVELAVVEGKVRVDPTSERSGARPAIVTRGDVVIARGASTLVAVKSEAKVADELSWRDGLLVFDRSTLADAAQEFNRYNRKKLVVADAEAGAIRIGGSFEAGNIDAFGRLLAQGFGLTIEDRGGEIVVSR